MVRGSKAQFRLGRRSANALCQLLKVADDIITQVRTDEPVVDYFQNLRVT